MNWLGVESTAAVQSLLTQAGVPNRSTGDVIQLEHVWVEALVDFSPSRGAVNQAPNTWVKLDPSFKQMSSQPSLNLRATVSMNEAGVFDAAKQGAMCTPDSARNLNLTNLQQSYSDYKAALATALAQQGSDLTVGQVLGSSVIAAENYSILLGTLPYKVIAAGTLVNTLPEQLRRQFHVQLFANASDYGRGDSTASFTASLTSVADQRLTLRFAPETAADAAVLAAYMPRAR